MSTVGFSLQEPSKSAKRKALLLSKQANAGQKPDIDASSTYCGEPRRPVADEAQSTIQIRNLNIELTCPVCLGILHNSMTVRYAVVLSSAPKVMECLHRFCSSCISKSLRLGKKECPTCRVKCASMRYLRADTNFDGIIAQIYPNLDEYEEKEDQVIDQINKNVMQSKTLLESVEKGKKRQALAKSRSKRDFSDMTSRSNEGREAKRAKTKADRKKARPDAPVAHPTPGDASQQRAFKQEDPPQEQEISFVLIRHNNEKRLPQLANKYLRTSKKLTILHLCKFLAKKFNQEDHKVFTVAFVEKPDTPLDLAMTLDQIDKQFTPRENEELTLVYGMTAQATQQLN